MALTNSFAILITLAMAVATNGKPEDVSSKSYLLKRYDILVKLNRGEFESPQVSAGELSKNFNVRQQQDLNRAVQLEMVCSYWYNILYHLHLTTPLITPASNYFPNRVDLYKRIDSTCTWAKNMLVQMFKTFVFTTDVDIGAYTNSFWLFYLNTSLLVANVASDADVTVLRNMHNGMYKLLRHLLPKYKCIMLNPRGIFKKDFERSFVDIRQEDPNYWPNVLKNLEKNCAQVKENMDISKIEQDLEGHFDMKKLYLNDVAESPAVMNSLITKFAVIDIGSDLVGFMTTKMEEIKNRATLFARYVYSLNSFLFCFTQLLNTIILKIFLKHLTYMETVKASQLPTEYKNFNNFLLGYVNLLCIEKEHVISTTIEDKFVDLMRQFNEKTVTNIDKIQGLKFQTIELINKIRGLLLADMESGKWTRTLDKYDNDVSTDQLKQFAQKKRIHFTNTYPDSIVFIQVFVEYIQKTLSEIDFKVIRSLMKLKHSGIFEEFLYSM